jgi:hypothetical protein
MKLRVQRREVLMKPQAQQRTGTIPESPESRFRESPMLKSELWNLNSSSGIQPELAEQVNQLLT